MSPMKEASPVQVGKMIKVAIAILLGLLAILFFAFPQHLREYRLYFTETRPRTVLSYEELSQDWSEEQVKSKLQQLQFRCYDNAPGEYLDERSCFADVSSHNGVPAMSLAFYFAKGKLNHMTVQVPWWHHRSLERLMNAAYGRPIAAQFLPVEGVRLAGWKLRSGNAMFMNRDLPFNPLSWSMVLWSSQRACQPKGCFLEFAP